MVEVMMISCMTFILDRRSYMRAGPTLIRCLCSDVRGAAALGIESRVCADELSVSCQTIKNRLQWM